MDSSAQHLKTAVEERAWERIRLFLRRIPPDLVPDRPEFYYIQAHVQWHLGQLEHAKQLFEQAKYYFRIVAQDLVRAALCSLEVADICHSRGGYLVAKHYVEEAAQYLARVTEQNSHIEARYRLIRSVVIPHVDKVTDGIADAQRAAQLFRNLADVPSEFLAQMAAASTAFLVGDYREAQARTEIARLLYSTGAVPEIYYARIINTDVHIQMFMGNHRRGLEYAQELLAFADAHEIGTQKIFARVLLANLRRNLGEFSEADHWYVEARQCAVDVDYGDFLIWIDTNRAWQLVMRRELRAARRTIERLLAQANMSQWMQINLIAAVLEILASNYDSADQLLQIAHAYYEEHGDPLMQCAVGCYIAYIHLRRGRQAEAVEGLTRVLAFFQQRNCDYFPHWWHPEIVAELCVFGLQAIPEQATLIERICIKHLGPAAASALTRDLDRLPPGERMRAQELLDRIHDTAYGELDFVRDGTVRQLLVEMLDEGRLRREGLPDLLDRLTTANHRRRPNPTLLAVFALYVNGMRRPEIAKTLNCSVQTVRNYINQGYRVFGIEFTRGASREERRRRLRDVAIHEGFL